MKCKLERKLRRKQLLVYMRIQGADGGNWGETELIHWTRLFEKVFKWILEWKLHQQEIAFLTSFFCLFLSYFVSFSSWASTYAGSVNSFYPRCIVRETFLLVNILKLRNYFWDTKKDGILTCNKKRNENKKCRGLRLKGQLCEWTSRPCHFFCFKSWILSNNNLIRQSSLLLFFYTYRENENCRNEKEAKLGLLLWKVWDRSKMRKFTFRSDFKAEEDEEVRKEERECYKKNEVLSIIVSFLKAVLSLVIMTFKFSLLGLWENILR